MHFKLVDILGSEMETPWKFCMHHHDDSDGPDSESLINHMACGSLSQGIREICCRIFVKKSTEIDSEIDPHLTNFFKIDPHL